MSNDTTSDKETTTMNAAELYVYDHPGDYDGAAHYEPIRLVADGCSFECVEKDAVAGGLRLTRDQLSHAGLDL